MKKYENPIINVSLFEAENIVTVSGGDVPQLTALEQANIAATELEGSQGTFTITF